MRHSNSASATSLAVGRPDIAIMVRVLDGGGAQRDAILFANALAAEGCPTTILTLDGRGPLRDLVASTVALREIGARHLRTAMPALRRQLNDIQPSVLFSSEAAQNVVVAAVVASLPRRRRPFLILREVASPSSAQSLDPYLQNRVAYRLLPYAARVADCLLTLTEGARDDLSRNFKVPADRIASLGTNAVIDAATTARLAAWDGERGREPGLIVSIGRLSPEKDQLTAIEAFARLPRDGPCRLAIVGTGPMRHALAARIGSLALQDRVTLVGPTTDPIGWAMRASVVLSTSRFEGLGNAIIEGLACGTPVVATDCPCGPREILGGGRWGRLVSVGAVDAVAQAIVEVLASPVDRAALVERAAHFTATAAARALLGLIEERRHAC